MHFGGEARLPLARREVFGIFALGQAQHRVVQVDLRIDAALLACRNQAEEDGRGLAPTLGASPTGTDAAQSIRSPHPTRA